MSTVLYAVTCSLLVFTLSAIRHCVGPFHASETLIARLRLADGIPQKLLSVEGSSNDTQ